MDIFEDDGATVRRDQTTLKAIHTSLQRHATMLENICPDLQEWGLQAAHFEASIRGSNVAAIVKVGLSDAERYYHEQTYLRAADFVPRVFEAGHLEEEINWVAFERIPWGPLGPLYQGREFDYLIDAGVRFQSIARDIEPRHLRTVTLASLRRAIELGSKGGAPGPVDAILERLEPSWQSVVASCGTEVCHGDLHLGNGLTRVRPPSGPVVLIDFSPVRQPWCFDAAYLEALNSGDPSRPNAVGIVARTAGRRRAMGLSVPDRSAVERASALALGWFAISHWSNDRDRQLPTYREWATRAVRAAAAVDP